jgi:hypothetical protein
MKRSQYISWRVIQETEMKLSQYACFINTCCGRYRGLYPLLGNGRASEFIATAHSY